MNLIDDDLRRVPRLLVTQRWLVFAFGLASSLCFLADGYDQQRVVQTAFLLAAGLLLAIGPGFAGALKPLANARASYFLAAFLLLGLGSSLFAYFPRYAFYEVANFALLLIIALSLAHQLARDYARTLPLLLKLIALGCAVYAFRLAVVYVAAITLGSQPSIVALVPGFGNYRFFNHVQTLTLPLLVLLFVLPGTGTRLKWSAFALAALSWAYLILCVGRGGVLGLCAGAMGAMMLRRGTARAYCGAMLLSALAGAAIYLVFHRWIPGAYGLAPFGELAQLGERTMKDPTSLRLPLWGRALDMMASHPWLGVGPLHFAHPGLDPVRNAHPHDWLLQIGAEWGLPALLCFCCAIAASLIRLLRSAARLAPEDRGNQSILAAWLTIGVAVLVDGLVSGLLVVPLSQLFIALYIALALAWVWSLEGIVPTARPSLSRRLAAALLAIAAVAGVAAGTLPELGVYTLHEGHSITMPGGVNSPRIWEDGNF